MAIFTTAERKQIIDIAFEIFIFDYTIVNINLEYARTIRINVIGNDLRINSDKRKQFITELYKAGMSTMIFTDFDIATNINEIRITK